ncbi:polyisoprenoid-binding protein [Malaciobacter halophilus]|uniref:Polyisoprenoid-binding protein n=1 Tax=Malaciobacter halophilus TaxID=197482 RepID=A0A2N1J163_9BACT|nr:YceI family protein [Malaciobacter halophilus]AXH08517.1 YceI-like domain-containing periplasmic protein [Malaciobacter halophilus]PKI80299.1 polyisoprenoid-binding protein [Malaciobacter halophilus]
MKFTSKVLAGLLMLVGLLSASPHAIDKAHSEVGFSVKHLMITNVKGEFKEFDAKVDFDYKTKVFKSLEATIKTKSIDTGIEKRDNHLRSADFFLAQKYPELKFVMKSYAKKSDDEGIMIGDLTIRGVTREVKLEVEIGGTIKDLEGNNRVGFSLEGEIDRTKYGLKWNKALEFGGIAVSEEVDIEVQVQAVEL